MQHAPHNHNPANGSSNGLPSHGYPASATQPNTLPPDTNLLSTPQTSIPRRGWRPNYETIGDTTSGDATSGDAHQADPNQPEPPEPDPQPRMSIWLACIISALVSSLFSVAGYHSLMGNNEPAAIVLHSPLAEPTATVAVIATPAPIIVFVSGSVRSVGVYELEIDARIEDAIVRAGGLLPEADPERVNRAAKLFDGAQVHIPQRQSENNDAAQLPPPPSVGLSGGGESAGDESTNSNSGKIDINQASQSAIESLPGIGASKATEIIAGRPYGSVDDLQKVSGIGAKTVDALREFVVVE